MLLLMFRDGRLGELPSVADVVHKEGTLVCLNPRGTIIASFPDEKLLYYTLDPQCIETIHAMERDSTPTGPVANWPERVPESVLERLWRMRKSRMVRLHLSGEENR